MKRKTLCFSDSNIMEKLNKYANEYGLDGVGFNDDDIIAIRKLLDGGISLFAAVTEYLKKYIN